MSQITLNEIDLDIIERAFAIAIGSGQMPDPNLLGDHTRVRVLRQALLDRHDELLREMWGNSRRRS